MRKTKGKANCQNAVAALQRKLLSAKAQIGVLTAKLERQSALLRSSSSLRRSAATYVKRHPVH
jgi:hypothetical protein